VAFGILKRKGKVYTEIVDDTRSRTLMPVIERKIALDSIVYTGSYRSYSALDASGFHHHRINQSQQSGDGKNHIDGIENFWSQAKRVLRKYNGLPKNTFPLFLKECERPKRLGAAITVIPYGDTPDIAPEHPDS
jgi:transposase